MACWEMDELGKWESEDMVEAMEQDDWRLALDRMFDIILYSLLLYCHLALFNPGINMMDA